MEIRDRDDFSVACRAVISGAISVGIFLLVAVFPLIVHNSYFDILETKYYCYIYTVLGTVGVILVISLVLLFIDCKEFQGEHVQELFYRLSPRRWRETFCPADAAVIVFWLIVVVSTLQSDYRYESFWGNEGRYTGLFLITLYVVSYFMISRFWNMSGWCIQLFLITGIVICLFGITDYFRMDIMGWRVNVRPDQLDMFTSTLGNVNSYTAYVGLMMGISTALFCLENKWLLSGWYYICMLISFFSVIMGTSDNAYLAVAALFGLTPFVLFRKRTSTGRYLVALASFFTAAWCIAGLSRMYAGRVVELRYSAFRILAEFQALPLVVAALWGAAALFIAAGRKKTEPTEDQVWCRPLLIFWTVFAAAVVLGVVFLLYDANAAGHAERYGALKEYLVFNDTWGTKRGFIWRRCIEIYRDFPLLRKLVGYGPDTFGILMYNEFHWEALEVIGQIVDNAHNEYLQYLVTIGAAGLLAYLCFLFLALKSMASVKNRNAYVTAAFCAVLCYVIQAVINLNLPITTPMMWLLLSIGTAGMRREG